MRYPRSFEEVEVRPYGEVCPMDINDVNYYYYKMCRKEFECLANQMCRINPAFIQLTYIFWPDVSQTKTRYYMKVNGSPAMLSLFVASVPRNWDNEQREKLSVYLKTLSSAEVET